MVQRDHPKMGAVIAPLRIRRLVVGDGAMGPWKAPVEVFPAARHQRCWVHKARNVTNCLPKSAQPGATKAVQEICNAEDRAHAEKSSEEFAPLRHEMAQGRREDHQRPGRAAGVLRLPSRALGPPADTRSSRRSSTVKPRTKVTRGAGSPAAALAMVFKLVESAQARWRAITGAHRVAIIRSGARFENGVLAERTDTRAA
ncbi:transposase [Streptomyces sp. NPDC052727]|uniref:transposase n=1 Tax=Streptomyces sp. NPDC052727 TaxID=3154854 RepID=UPI003415D96B